MKKIVTIQTRKAREGACVLTQTCPLVIQEEPVALSPEPWSKMTILRCVFEHLKTAASYWLSRYLTPRNLS